MSRFTQTVLGAIVALGICVTALAFVASRLGPTVDTFTTAQALDGTAVNTQIAITFSAPMQIRTVEKSFSIAPKVKGFFNWAGNELIFSPSSSLAYGRAYTVSIATVARGTDGKRLQHPFKQRFVTETQHLVYLGTRGSQRGRLILATVTGKEKVLGPNDGSVTGYSVSPDRSTIAYVRRGSPGESPDEIWLVSLVDGSTRMVARRPGWTITAPQLSPDDRTIVFLAIDVKVCRQYYGCQTDTTIPLIYFADVTSGRVYPYANSTDTPVSDFVAWSPASQIAYTDLGSALVLADLHTTRITHLPNRGDSLLFTGFDASGDKVAFVGQTPTSTGGDVVVYTHGSYVDVSHGMYDAEQPAFSTAGNEIVYSAYHGEYGQIPNLQPVYGLNVYDFKTRRTYRLTNEHNWTDWGAAWSQDDQYVAFVRTRPEGTLYLGSGQLWVIHPNGTGAHPVAGIGKDVAWVG